MDLPDAGYHMLGSSQPHRQPSDCRTGDGTGGTTIPWLEPVDPEGQRAEAIQHGHVTKRTLQERARDFPGLTAVR